MYKYIHYLCAAAICLVMSSAQCSDTDDEPDTPPTGQTPGDEDSDGDSGDSGLSERTVLVYMVANNSLGRYKCDTKDKAEMESAIGMMPEGCRWIVYHAPSDGTDPTLSELTPEGWQTLREYDNEEYSVSSARMSRVIADTREVAPARHYGLVLWSHGNGWLQNGMESTPAVSPQSFGDDRGRTMNITTLASVLGSGNFDYIYTDCCYMATVEVAYELRNAARYLVASPSEVPLDGMPYNENLPLLADGSLTSLTAAARNTFEYYDALTGSERTCTMSVIDLGAMEWLAAATAHIYLDGNVSFDTTEKVQKYMTESTCYYYDFRDYIDKHEGVPADSRAAWDAALADAVIYEAATPWLWNRLAMESHCGLSSYVVRTPEDATTRNYHTLSWSKLMGYDTNVINQGI